MVPLVLFKRFYLSRKVRETQGRSSIVSINKVFIIHEGRVVVALGLALNDCYNCPSWRNSEPNVWVSTGEHDDKAKRMKVH